MDEEKSPQQTDAPLQLNEQQINQTAGDPSDRLTPDHPRFKEVIAKNHELEETIKSLNEKMEALQADITDRQSSSNSDELTVDEEAALERIAAGLARKGKIVTPDQLSSERRAYQYERLSERHNGSDGYPKFVPTDVETFARKNGLQTANLEDVYYIMNRTAIAQVDARKMSNSLTAPASEKPTPAEDTKPASDQKILTAEDIAKMTDDEYEQYRDSIHRSFKANKNL